MTAPATPFGQPHPRHAAQAMRIPLAPEEGWLTVLLLAIMAASVAWSIDDARWLFGQSDLTPFLLPASLAGTAYGFIAAKVGWPRRIALPVGAALAALILPVMVGGVLAPGASFAGQYRATAASVVQAFVDVVRLGHATTPQYGHWLLVFAVLAWATGQFATYTTLHHRRAINAVLLAGGVLVTNMCLTTFDQFPDLVVFSVAGLLLLIRMHAAEERSTWISHQVWRAGTIDTPYLRGGLLFVALIVTGSVLLTATASSAPLAGLFVDVNNWLIDVGRQYAGVLPPGQASRIAGSSFPTTLTIGRVWQTDAAPVLRIQVPGSGEYHWRVIAYDRFTGSGWTQTSTASQAVPAGTKVLAGTTEGSLPTQDRQTVSFQVTPLDATLQDVVSPDTPLTVNQQTRLTAILQADQTFFASLGLDTVAPYAVTASVPQIDPSGVKGLTANELRAAGTDYPAALEQVYTEILPDTVGSPTRLLLNTILEGSKATDPYDIAREIESYLRDPAHFTYQTNVASVDCGGLSVVDCFVKSRVGYCEYYASLMTMMLRVEQIPARMVEGYLPTTPDANGVETITRDQAHAWVEAYFPGYGWIEFDPTGGNQAFTTPLPAGPPVPSATRTTAPSTSPGAGGNAPNRRFGDQPTRAPGSSTPGSGADQATRIGLIGGALLLFALVLGMATWAYRRRQRTLPTPDGVYRGVTGWARRLGYGQRPTQTVFEYMGALGDLVPLARPELEVVAAAKVEVAYGRRELPVERLRLLRVAQSRLRLSLLRLLLRRPRRRPGA